MPLSTLGSPSESGHLYSPAPLSAPSPILGPVNNAFVDKISSTLQMYNLNDVPQQPAKIELELEKPSTRDELAELSKQELIEKVMQYERQMEGSIPLRRMSTVKQEAENEDMKDIQCRSSMSFRIR